MFNFRRIYFFRFWLQKYGMMNHLKMTILLRHFLNIQQNKSMN